MQTAYSTTDLPTVEGARVAVLMSKWHREHSERMSTRCCALLREAGCLEPDVHVLPGCIELPLAALRIANSVPRPEAIIVFGVILKGDTYHFDMVMQLFMSGIQQVMFQVDIPIINEVLPVDSLDDVVARSGDDEKNKGIEAALAAVEIIDWRRKHPASIQTS